MALRTKKQRPMRPASEFRYLIELERGRVHREGHQFSLVTFAISEKARRHQNLDQLVTHIHTRIRKIDQLGWYDDDHIGLLLPHTSIQGARKVAGDISNHNWVRENLSSCDVYVYP